MSALPKRIPDETHSVDGEAEIVRTLLRRVDPPSAVGAVLAISELLPDAGGEIVLRPGGVDRHFRLLVDRLPAARGRAAPHVTAAGENVAGMCFMRFEPGPVIYYPMDVELELVLVQG